MNKSPCFMLAKQRSGTRVFGHMLASHPAVAYCNEVFHEGASAKNGYFDFLKHQIQQDPKNLEYLYPDQRKYSFKNFLDALGNEYSKDKFVLDLKYNQLHHLNDYWHLINSQPKIFNFIKENNYPVIHLIRKNILNVIVSQTMAAKHHIWHAKQENIEQIKKTTIRLDPNTTLNQIKTRKKEIERISSFFKKYDNIITLYYEDLFDESHEFSKATAKTLSNLLKIDSSAFDLKPVYIKQTSILADVIENFDEIKQKLQNTEFEYFL
jgi:hypothetical protein